MILNLWTHYIVFSMLYKDVNTYNTLIKQRQEKLLKTVNYEIVEAVQVDINGNVLANNLVNDSKPRKRTRRDVENDLEEVYYKVQIAGNSSILELKSHVNLTSGGYHVEYWSHQNVTKESHNQIQNCHYRGRLLNHTGYSDLAVSNCIGLNGIMQVDQDHYFIEPLWNGTKFEDHEVHPHVIYKKDLDPASFSDGEVGHCGYSDVNDTKTWWNQVSRHTDPSSRFRKRVRSRSKSRSNKKFQEKSRNRRSVATFTRRYVNRNKAKWSEIRSTENIVESLVVLDKRVIELHGREMVETYILTIMNIVAKLYEDPTLGNRVKIVVVRLIVLLEDQQDLSLVHHAERTLTSFCKWQHLVNADQKTSLQEGIAHHDNAILLTGYDICAKQNAPCGTLGLAGVQGMCDSRRSCNINQDIGLASGFIIAHEMGHNFGMHHDGISEHGSPDCKGPEKPQLMAPQINSGAYPFTWSQCSRKSITNFLDSGSGGCLLNQPLSIEQTGMFSGQDDLVKRSEGSDYSQSFAGRVHDADAQCRFIFGPRSRHCVYGNICSQLYCYQTNKKCSTISMPAAQGTICRIQSASNEAGGSIQGWCYKGECVPEGFRPQSVDGNWGHWNHWSECTRTCGIGVSFQSRLCDNPRPLHGGHYCLGERRRYRTCNTEECDVSPLHFREIQCSKFNNSPFQNRYYNWVPYTKGKTQPCALACKPEKKGWYSELAPQVIDGTRCYDDGESLHVCIRGKCHDVGCNRDLDESREFDNCMKCGGDNTSCEIVTDNFTQNMTNIDCSEPKNDQNTSSSLSSVNSSSSRDKNSDKIASSSRDGRFVRSNKDGNKNEDCGKLMEIFQIPSGATKMSLTQSQSSNNLILIESKHEGSKQPIITRKHGAGGPKKSQKPQSNVFYSEYSKSFFNLTYFPETSAWNITSNGPLKMPIKIKLLIRDPTAQVELKYFTPITRDPSELKKYKWGHDAWSPCSVTCAGGIQTRKTVCIRIADDEVVSNGLCDPEDIPEDISQTCRTNSCPEEWRVKPWRPCSRTCGGGLKTREVYCVRVHSNIKEPVRVENKHCQADDKPAQHEENCNTTVCPPQWKEGSWGSCKPCGRGWAHRVVTCMDWNQQKVLPDPQCDPQRKPKTSKRCHKRCPLPRWKTGKWSECSVACGHGYQQRQVKCQTHDNRLSTHCHKAYRPVTKQNCRGQRCNEGANDPLPTDDKCVDINKVAYCPLVHKFNFCNRAYFRKMCCKTCRGLDAKIANGG